MGKTKLTTTDDDLLDRRIEESRVEFPRNTFLAIAFITALTPVYIAHAIFEMWVTSPLNIVIFLCASGAVTHLLKESYHLLAEGNFFKWDRPLEKETEEQRNQLKSLRLQMASAHAFFVANGVYVMAVLFFQLYLLRTLDYRLGFVLAQLFSGSIVWVTSQKNNETVRRRTGRAKATK